MRKLLFFTLIAFGISLSSCDKSPEAGPEGNLIDVTLSSGVDDAKKTRTLVTASGVTRWAVGDNVSIVDADPDHSIRTFSYTGTSASANGQFKGQLQKGQKAETYYAFYGTEYAPCTLDGEYYHLTVDYVDLNVDNATSSIFGKYCPMVAIPVEFKVETSVNAGIEFHHVASLIEASVAFGEDSDLNSVSFDRVVFELRAQEEYANAFNSKIKIDMTQINGKPEVDIPYTECDSKLSALTTTLTYSNTKNLGEVIAASDTGGFSIPIFALPTKADFYCDASVTFYNGEEIVCVLSRSGGFNTLKPSGLNTLDFDEQHVVGW